MDSGAGRQVQLGYPYSVPERRGRPVRRAVVRRTEWLTPGMVRVVFCGRDVAGLPPLQFTDAYIKILFPPAGAAYRWPFDPEELRQTQPRDWWPVTRTYTIRSLDLAAGEMTVDFVVHGAEGLAGPWAAAARPGNEIGFHGPGGGFVPDAQPRHHLLVGDEAAAPAIAAALERLPVGASAAVFLEVADAAHRLAWPVADDGIAVELNWVHRDGRAHGGELVAAVRAAGPPPAGTQVFIHGNAEMVRDLRRFLFVEHRLARQAASISGYWRTGFTEDRWQSTKRDFTQQLESEERVGVG